MSDGWNIALLGATGAVGTALLELLQEREFPVGELYLLASDRGAGETLRFGGKSVMVTDAAEFDWTQAQLAFFVAGEGASALYAEPAAAAGCVVIDSSGLFALAPDVPLVAPGVNDAMLADYRNRSLIAVADSLTCQLLLAVRPLSDLAGITRLHVSNLLSVSAHGKAAVDALAGQSVRLLNGMPIEPGFFNRQLAFNLFPLTADEQGSIAVERRLVDEVRKVLQDDGLPISVGSVQAPVFYGHGQIVHLETQRPMGVEEARAALEEGENIDLSPENDFPTQVDDASGKVRLSIGCLQNDYGMPDLLRFWSVADNVRFGGALMAVEVAERLLAEYFY